MIICVLSLYGFHKPVSRTKPAFQARYGHNCQTKGSSSVLGTQRRWMYADSRGLGCQLVQW